MSPPKPCPGVVDVVVEVLVEGYVAGGPVAGGTRLMPVVNFPFSLVKLSTTCSASFLVDSTIPARSAGTADGSSCRTVSELSSRRARLEPEEATRAALVDGDIAPVQPDVVRGLLEPDDDCRRPSGDGGDEDGEERHADGDDAVPLPLSRPANKDDGPPGASGADSYRAGGDVGRPPGTTVGDGRARAGVHERADP